MSEVTFNELDVVEEYLFAARVLVFLTVLNAIDGVTDVINERLKQRFHRFHTEMVVAIIDFLLQQMEVIAKHFGLFQPEFAYRMVL